MRDLRLLALLTALLALSVRADSIRAVGLVPVVWDLQQPVAMADDGTGRLMIVEQRGVIRLVEGGRLSKNVVIDLTAQVEFSGECGLLSLALHPDFQKNGRLFVTYLTKRQRPTTGDSKPVPRSVMQTVVSEFVVELRTLSADPKSEREILRFDQPFPNHKGGDLKFGPDGMLYISTGDGGGREDPLNNAQSLGNLLGKILRIDVNGKQPCTIPPDNPFVGLPQARPEIWAYGLCNPRRFSFDRVVGDLYASEDGDLGEQSREEINLIEKGKNYGWSAREGTQDFLPNRAAGPLQDPIKEYGQNTGTSVIGGYVYRGKLYPRLDGVYLYGDLRAQRIFGLRRSGLRFDGALARTEFPISAFGEDHDGELYVLNYEGQLYRIVMADPALGRK